MKKQCTNKVLGYRIKKQIHSGFKIVEFSQRGDHTKKRTIHKNLDLSAAEDILYQLEKKLN